MPMTTPRELFLHELSDTYSAEQIILTMLPKLANEVTDKKLAKALQDHEKETRQQIEHLDEVFRILGEKPEQMTCYGVEGFKQEHDEFVKEKPSPEILTLFITGAAGKTEHYEIESYSGLIEMARLLGERDVVKLLQENLKQEQEMAKQVQQFEKELAKQLVPQLVEAEQASSDSVQ
jgi:ferritin-like metal-binding protein YciE